MPIATTLSTDYTDRQIDLETWQTAKVPSALLRINPSLTKGGETRKVTGIQKLVQRYLMLMFTIKGDTKFDEDTGSTFLINTRIGGAYTREQLLHSFVFANTDVVAQLRQEDNDTTYGFTPDDERISQAVLQDYDVDAAGRMLIRVRITSRAGEVVTFIVPTS